MKFGVVVLMVMTMAAQVSLKTAIWVHFQINRPDIVRSLCQSRNLKVNHCQGKCQLQNRFEQNPVEDDLTFPGFSMIKDMKIVFTLVSLPDYFSRPKLFVSKKVFFSHYSRFIPDYEKGKLIKPPAA